MSDQQFYVVGIHGPPTPKTAPHGVMYRTEKVRRWDYCSVPWEPGVTWNDHEEWVPLPPPPTEQAPPPEPVARWVATWDHDGWLVRSATPDDGGDGGGAEAAADALNTLDRDGVAWGPGRPMEELPDGHPEPVLIRWHGGLDVSRASSRRNDAHYGRVCWWPLPLPGEAT